MSPADMKAQTLRPYGRKLTPAPATMRIEKARNLAAISRHSAVGQ